jgi:hypothetical protein
MLRNIFLALFLVSSLVLIVLTVSEFGLINALSQASPSPSDNPSVETPPRISEGIGFTVVGSVITSVISLVGFVITTTITWRKEKREASLADVERKKLEVELEKSRLELEEMKRAAEKKEKSWK